MATVITSLVTTIPVVGKQVVYWLWGGLEKASVYSDIDCKTLFNAGNSLIFSLFCMDKTGLLSEVYGENMVQSYILNSLGFRKNVKIFCTLTQSAGWGVGSAGLKSKFSTQLTNIHSQRLDAENLIWFVGFSEGDGCFSVNKNGRYVKYEFAIETSLRDIQCLYKIKKMLGVGSITVRKRQSVSNYLARLKISSKPQLINIILPIFDSYEMLTSKHEDFLHFKRCLTQNIIFFTDVPAYERSFKSRFNTVESLLEVDYFDRWLVGFIEAEGSFSNFLATDETNFTASFSICQTGEPLIMEAIRKRLKLKSKVSSDVCSKNRQSFEKSYRINVTSSHGIQNIINFLKQASVKLKGIKRANYLNWLHQIRANPRYKSVKVPIHY